MTARKAKQAGTHKAVDVHKSPLFAAHNDWLKCRARLAEWHAYPARPVSGADVRACLQADNAATWNMLQAPAADLPDIRLRAQIVETMFSDGPMQCDRTKRLMLAVLISEIQGTAALIQT